MPTNLPEKSISDDWKHALARRVNELVSTPERMDSFRDRLDDWCMRELIRYFQGEAWKRRRKWHERNAWSSDRLKDERAGPPPNHLSTGHSDWVIDHCELDGRHFWAWMPIQYADANKPNTSLPLPLKKHEPTLWEKFIILAVLHDVVLDGVSRIVLWCDLQSSTNGGMELEHVARVNSFRLLCKQIPKLTGSDQFALGKFLVDVCVYLKVATPTAESKLLPWADKADGFIFVKEAIKMLPDGTGASFSGTSKLLKPNGQIQYMTKGRRTKVHVGDWKAYYEAKRHPPSSTELFKALGTYQDDIKKRMAAARAKKRRNE